MNKEPHYEKLQYHEQKEYPRGRNGRLGHKHTAEAKEKIRLGNVGKLNSTETRRKISEAKFGIKIRPMSSNGRENIRLSKLGSKNPAWRGGKTPLMSRIRNSNEMISWRNDIFKRDGYTCQECGKYGTNLNADHIKPFSVIIDENKINSFELAIKCAELWDRNNGRTLCVDCHKRLGIFGGNTINTYYDKSKLQETRITNTILWINTAFTILAGIATTILAILSYYKK